MSYLEFSQFRNEKTIINTFKTDEMEKLKKFRIKIFDSHFNLEQSGIF